MAVFAMYAGIVHRTHPAVRDVCATPRTLNFATDARESYC